MVKHNTSYLFQPKVGLFSFATFVLISSNNILDANKAFVSLSLFNLMSKLSQDLKAIIKTSFV